MKLITMDLNKLLNESESMKQAIADQKKADDLKQHLGISHPGELDKIMSAACSGVVDSAAFTSEKVARQAAETALGISGFMPPDFDTAGEKMRKKFERTAGLDAIASSDPQSLADRFRADIKRAAGGIGIDHASFLKDPPTINFEEIERRERERQLQTMSDAAWDNMQHIARQAAEHQRREEAKVEYARRSAEASEEALAEERRKRELAEIAAKEAKADKEKAEERADRAEVREEKMVRLTNSSIVVALVSAAMAAWLILKDHKGW